MMQKNTERGPKMKQLILTTFILILSIFVSLPAQANDPNEAYIKAVTNPDLSQQIRLFKEYLENYEGKGTQYENFVLANLCLLSYRGKTAKETIEYGEKALALGGLDDFTKCKVLIQLSGIYSQSGQNLEKAKNYALQIVQISKTNKKQDSVNNPSQWNQLIGAGYFAHGQALEKSKDLRGAIDSYISSYNILKDKQIATCLKKIGKSLYDLKFYKDAEEALKVSSASLKDIGSCTLYAKILYKNGKKEEALKYFKQSYAKQKNGQVAYNIGIILAGKAKTDPSLSSEAIRYLLDASFLYPSNSKKAMSLAESLFFTFNHDLHYNENVKEIKERNNNLTDLTYIFNKKFEDKDEEELDSREKKQLETLLTNIESEKKAIAKLEAEQKASLGEFNKLIEQTKQRLGIR